MDNGVVGVGVEVEQEFVMSPTYDDSGVTLKELLDALRDNGRTSQEDRKQLQQKMDDLARNINDIRREQQLAIENLRRDFERLFVPRSEYDPKHEVILDKIKQYDGILNDSRKSTEEHARYKADVDGLKEDIKEIKMRQQGTMGRVLPIVSTAVSIAAVLLAYAQHIQFH